MKHGSLFSGIGGFDLASEWMGWDNVFQVEIDDYCQKVLAKNFPNVKRYGDIKEFKGEAGSVDILTGGFPCQPFSHAGKRKGQSDDRYLWPEYLRVIREIKPTYVVGENVAGLISMEDGKTLDGILSDLEGEGYAIESFIIPSCGVGAWHRRDRIWIIAYNNSRGRRERENGKVHRRRLSNSLRDSNSKDAGKVSTDTKCKRGNSRKIYTGNNQETLQGKKTNSHKSMGKDVSDTNSQGLQVRPRREFGSIQCEEKTPQGSKPGRTITEGWKYWATEPNMGRVANGISNRVDRLKGLGNAIVPQVAYEIFKAIDLNKQL